MEPAVEEQFYLAYPLILIALIRYARPAAPWLLVGLAVASLALAEWGWRVEPEMNFFFTLSRFWELLAGGLAAMILDRRAIASHGGMAALGLVVILAAFFLHDATTPYPSFATLLPVGGTVLLVLFAGPRTVVGRLLSRPPMVAVGLVSYSAYLWHQPLFALARVMATDAPAPILIIFLTLLTYVLAAASWAYVEQPFRRPLHRWLDKPREIFGASGVAAAMLAVVAVAGLATSGNDAAWRAAHPDRTAMLDVIVAARENSGLPADDGSCRFNLTEIDAAARASTPALIVMDPPQSYLVTATASISFWPCDRLAMRRSCLASPMAAAAPPSRTGHARSPNLQPLPQPNPGFLPIFSLCSPGPICCADQMAVKARASFSPALRPMPPFRHFR